MVKTKLCLYSRKGLTLMQVSHSGKLHIYSIFKTKKDPSFPIPSLTPHQRRVIQVQGVKAGLYCNHLYSTIPGLKGTMAVGTNSWGPLLYGPGLPTSAPQDCIVVKWNVTEYFTGAASQDSKVCYLLYRTMSGLQTRSLGIRMTSRSSYSSLSQRR